MSSVQAEEAPAANNPSANAPVAPAAPANAKGKSSVHKLDFEKDVVYLYQFVRCPTVPSASPFCLKVETFLRMVELKYENVDHKMKYKSKKGQLPFIEVNGVEISDSDIIIKELSQMYGKNIDEDLTPDQKSISHAFISMLNNHTSWVVRVWRYSHPGDFLKSAQLDIKHTLNSKLPKGVLQFLFKLGFKSNVKRAVYHGIGRNSSDEIQEFGEADLKALSDFLAEKPYFFGEEPHLLDCVAFSHLCQFIYVPFNTYKAYFESECTNLLSFVERMKERYWPDWDETCKSLDLNSHLPKKEEPAEEKKPDAEKEEKADNNHVAEKEEKAEEPQKEEKKEDKAEEKTEEKKEEEAKESKE